MTLEQQSPFAKHLGRDKACITRLKRAGVMEWDRVNAEASLTRIQATRGDRLQVADDHAGQRDHESAFAAWSGMADTGGDLSLEKVRRVHAINDACIKIAEADQDEMGRDKMAGHFIAKQDVDFVLRDFDITVSRHLENVANRLAPIVNHQIERLPVDNLVPCARSASIHSVEQIAQIVTSIREYGFTNSVLIDESSGIIACHHQVLAAHTLLLYVVPCLRLAGHTDARHRACILADNRIALNAGQDPEMPAAELKDLRDDGYKLDLIGFDTDFMADLLAESVSGHDPHNAPPLPVDLVSVTGDIWIPGQHRLVWG